MIYLLINLLSHIISPTMINCDEISIEEEVKQRDLIVVALLMDDLDDKYLLKVSQSFKGFAGEHIVIRKENIALQHNTDYILFLNRSDDSYYLVKPCSKSEEVKHIDIEIIKYLQNLPCFDPNETIEERKKRNPNLTGACRRDYRPVCGCDGITYGNTCELHNKGIMKYSPGECPE